MGPSLVLSSRVSMAAEWNRTSLNLAYNNSSSSNDDEDELEGQVQRSNVTFKQNQTKRTTASGLTEQGPPSDQSSAVASFRSQSEVHSELQRQQAVPFPFNSTESEQFEFEVSTATDAMTLPESTFTIDFSTSPLHTSSRVTEYASMLGGVEESSTSQLEMNIAEEDDRKPAAVASPQKVDPEQRDLQSEIISPHRKSHSISSDPFHSTYTMSNVEQYMPLPSRERFIDPALSFDDEYDQRDFRVPSIIPSAWETYEQNDPKFKSHRRRQNFTPPHADFTAPARSSYFAAAPQAIAFKLGEESPDFDNNLRRDIQDVVDSVAASTRTRKIVSNRQSLPIAVHQPLRPAARNIVLQRREASAAEIESAETDRARSAIHVWYKRFNELIEYCETYGDCNVPQKYPPNAQLGIWVNKQRMEKKFLDENKRTSMTAAKVEALESIGFTWAKRKGDASWLYKYHELQRFLEHFGSCDVPTKYTPNPALGRWVSTQRSEYKVFMQTGGRSRHLTQEKIDMLNAIGFKWEMIPSRLSNSSNHSNGTSSSSSHNTNTSSHGTVMRRREV